MKRAVYQTTRRLTQEEVAEAMANYPRPIRMEPVVRIRYVFVALLMVAVGSMAGFMDLAGWLAGCGQ